MLSRYEWRDRKHSAQEANVPSTMAVLRTFSENCENPSHQTLRQNSALATVGHRTKHGTPLAPAVCGLSNHNTIVVPVLSLVSLERSDWRLFRQQPERSSHLTQLLTPFTRKHKHSRACADLRKLNA